MLLPSGCLFSEGRIVLPDGYQDRTVNVFTPVGTGLPAFNISRDTLGADETLAGYIDRQLALMAQHLKAWKQSDRCPIALGEALLPGECVHASYLNGGQRIWQQQAVFNTADSHILVFTMTASTALRDTDCARFQTLLGSFRCHG